MIVCAESGDLLLPLMAPKIGWLAPHIRIRHPQPRQNLRLPRLHRLGVFFARLVVSSLRVKGAAHQKVHGDWGQVLPFVHPQQ